MIHCTISYFRENIQSFVVMVYNRYVFSSRLCRFHAPEQKYTARIIPAEKGAIPYVIPYRTDQN